MDFVFVYFGRVYTVAACGVAWREQTCEQCGGTFHYPAVFEAAGTAESPFFLNNAGAQARAERRAAAAAARAAATTTVAVPCRHCGWFQRAMIPTFRAMLWPDLGRIGTMLAGAGLMLGMIAAIIWVGGADPATPAVEGARLLGTCFLFAAPGLTLLAVRRWKQLTFDPNRDLGRATRLRMATVTCLTAAEFVAAQSGESHGDNGEP